MPMKSEATGARVLPTMTNPKEGSRAATVSVELAGIVTIRGAVAFRQGPRRERRNENGPRVTARAVRIRRSMKAQFSRAFTSAIDLDTRFAATSP